MTGLHRERPRRRDSGAVLILVALAITGLFLIVAIVIDLGSTRSDRRSGQLAVDNATSSAGQAYARHDDDVVSACEDAFDYLALSLGTEAFTGDPCSLLAAPCVSTIARPIRRTAGGEFTATVHNPVVDGSTLMDAPSTIGADPMIDPDDGAPCDRIGVTLETTGDPFFGRVAGSTGRTSEVHAVSLIERGYIEFRPINLLVLNRTDCDVFTIGGGGNDAHVIVATPTDDPSAPGVAALDSDASACSSNKSTLALNGTGSTLIAQGPCGTTPETTCATGRIELFTPVSDGSCEPTVDVPACNEGTGSITPNATTSRARYTRAPVDYRYNCKPTYDPVDDPDLGEPWYSVQPIPGCPSWTSTTDYVDDLKDFASAATAPSGFTPITGAACNQDRFPPGNYWMDCGNFQVTGGRDVVFEAGNVIFRGNVSVNSGSLTFNQCAVDGGCSDSIAWTSGSDFDERQYSAKSAWVYTTGSVSNSDTLTLNNTALFLDSESSQFSTSGNTTWTAPDEGNVADSAGPFDDLSLWSEGLTTNPGNSHSFRGSGTSTFEGLFFGGRAAFDMAGSGPVNLRVAQFVSDKIHFSGGATFTMSPVSDRGVEFPIDPTFRLIR